MEELNLLLDEAYKIGVAAGIELMKQQMLQACENGRPIEISGEVYFVHDAIYNLRCIFEDLEHDAGGRV